MSAVLELPRHRFSRVQYERMAEAGVFGPKDRVELLDGDIIDRAPQKSWHATAVTLVAEALRTLFGPGAAVRVQLPFGLDDSSEPEPDVAAVPGNPRDYRDAHPSRALLVCEVSGTTFAYDRGRKLAAYARAGIPEYWILDLAAETLEICRKPEHNGYAQRWTVAADGRISAEGSAQTILVTDLLPRTLSWFRNPSFGVPVLARLRLRPTRRWPAFCGSGAPPRPGVFQRGRWKTLHRAEGGAPTVGISRRARNLTHL